MKGRRITRYPVILRTLQYGEFIDEMEIATPEALQWELETIRCLRTVEVVSITEVEDPPLCGLSGG